MRRTTVLGFVLLFAVATHAFAEGGPPVPDGCTFERGVTTCVAFTDAYVPGTNVFAGDRFCYDTGSDLRLFELVHRGGLYLAGAKDRITTEYRGASHVAISRSVQMIVTAILPLGGFDIDFVAVGSC